MILALRQRHRHLVIALGIFLPVVFAVGVVARKPVPTMAALPGGLAPIQSRPGELVRDFLGKNPLGVGLFRDLGNKAALSVQIISRFPPVGPDLLVYWIPAAQNFDRNLPDDARLLGAFAPGMVLALPPETIHRRGRLLLYSLANQEVLETSGEFVAAAMATRPGTQLLALNSLPDSLPPARSKTLGCLMQPRFDNARALGSADPVCGSPAASGPGD